MDDRDVHLPAGDPTGAGAPSARARRKLRWQALVDAIAAVRSTDPARVESALKDLGGRRRAVAPLVFAAGTVAVVFDGVLLLLRNWRLTLLQLSPAAWISIMSWNLKEHLLSRPSFSTDVAAAAAVGVLLAAQVAYWCNATFAYTISRRASGEIRAAFHEARAHWRLIGGLAMLTGGVQAAIWLLLPRLHVDWLWVALLAMFIVQVYLFIAVPCWLVGVQKTGTRRDRATLSAATGVLQRCGVDAGFPAQWDRLAAPRIGPTRDHRRRCSQSERCCTVTASSSVRVVKLSVRLRADKTAPAQKATNDVHNGHA